MLGQVEQAAWQARDFVLSAESDPRLQHVCNGSDYRFMRLLIQDHHNTSVSGPEIGPFCSTINTGTQSVIEVPHNLCTANISPPQKSNQTFTDETDSTMEGLDLKAFWSIENLDLGGKDGSMSNRVLEKDCSSS